MRVWIVCDHEPLPSDPDDRRLMRAGMLSQALAEAGHQTTWFTSSFDHYLKRHRKPAETGLALQPNLTARVLAAPGYRRNVDVARLLHNAVFAQAFRRVARHEAPPDVVVAAIPTTDAAAAAVGFAESKGIPSIVDIYDPWPDSFARMVPRAILMAGAPIMYLLQRQARFACSRATSLVGTSQSYLRWGQAKGCREGREGADRYFPLGYAPRPPSEGRAFLDRLGIGHGDRVVSFVGSWGTTHNIDLVAEAAASLSGRQDIRFVVAGDNSNRPRLRAKLAALHNVVLTGWLNASEVALLLSASEIGLLPYRQAAPQRLPNKCFEYMAYGAYQIGTLRGEIEKLFAETGTGRSVEPTGEALAAAVRDHLSSPSSREQRDRRIAAFQERFAGAGVYLQMVRHVEDVVALGRPAG